MSDRSADWIGQADRDIQAARAGEQPGLRDAARMLDRYYVPARYPHGYADGKPGDYTTSDDANNTARSAEEILRFCHGLLA
ncbi:MAG: HEPN domain-containing protein [Spirochaetota bacterium]